MNNHQPYERYQRQIILPGMGAAGQDKLLQAKVLVIGAGGLSCPVLQYLVAAGVGTIGIVDDDVVSLTNLHRQVLFNMNHLGKLKASTAAVVLKQLNPEVHIISYPVRLTTQNALETIAAYDVVVDGTDNFATRYMVNDACVLLGKPLVYGAISRFEGQVAVFNIRQGNQERGVNYRDLFITPPASNEVLNCEEAGVLGVLPGIIGSLMANETIKLITGIGQLLAGSLLTYHALNNQFYEVGLSVSPEALKLIPPDENAFRYMNYGWQCAINSVGEINWLQFNRLIKDKNTLVIDVREIGELPELNEFDHLRIPLPQLGYGIPATPANTIITLCQSGKRSKQAAHVLAQILDSTKTVYSLEGGITAWLTQKQ